VPDHIKETEFGDAVAETMPPVGVVPDVPLVPLVPAAPVAPVKRPVFASVNIEFIVFLAVRPESPLLIKVYGVGIFYI
jgi:hypothetical protein